MIVWTCESPRVTGRERLGRRGKLSKAAGIADHARCTQLADHERGGKLGDERPRREVPVARRTVVVDALEESGPLASACNEPELL